MSLLAQRNSDALSQNESIWKQRRVIKDVTVGVIILSETLLGGLGNFFLVYHYTSLYCTEGRVRTTNFILMHLTVSNSLIILTVGLPKTVVVLGLTHFFSNVVCNLIWYVQRVGKSMSVGCTFLLCVFQAIRTSPMDSCKDLKVKVPQYVTGSVSLCWILYMSVNLIISVHILYVFSKWNMKNFTMKNDLGFCYISNKNLPGRLYFTLHLFPNIVLLVLIVWANGSMILFLHRHKQRVQHIHSNHVSSRSSAESRATQRILVLVSTFVCSNTLSLLFQMCVGLFNFQSEWLLNILTIASLFFPSVSPFLFMERDSTVFRLSLGMIRKMPWIRKYHGHTKATPRMGETILQIPIR